MPRVFTFKGRQLKEWGATSCIHKSADVRRILLYIYCYYDWRELSVTLTSSLTLLCTGHCALFSIMHVWLVVQKFEGSSRFPCDCPGGAGIENKMFRIGAQGSDRRVADRGRQVPTRWPKNHSWYKFTRYVFYRLVNKRTSARRRSESN